MSELMNLGDLNRRLGDGLAITSDLLSNLGIQPVETDKRARLYSEAQWPLICKEIARYVQGRLAEPCPPRPQKVDKKGAGAGKIAPPPADDDDDL